MFPHQPARFPSWLIVASLLLTTPAWAIDVLAEIRTRVGTPESIRGQFEQKKYIEALERPLLSKGEFLVARNRGVIWRTQTPFPQTLKLTRRDIVQEQNGQERFRLSAEREPAVRAINQVLFALFSGDFNALEKSFTLSGKLDKERWQVALQPASASLAQLFKEIRLEGVSYVQGVTMLEANGDRTEIRFSRVQTNSALSVEEARQFD